MDRIGKLAAVAAAGLVFGSAAARAQDFRLTSPDLSEGGTLKPEQVFKGFGCAGGNVSPALSWSGVPAAAKSLALTVYDPDAPTGSGFWHWVVANIPVATQGLPRDAGNPAKHLMPKGAVTVHDDYGIAGFGGACPPPGDKPHRYILTLFAVDQAKLPVNASVSPAVVGFNLHFHTIAKATLTGMYGVSQ